MKKFGLFGLAVAAALSFAIALSATPAEAKGKAKAKSASVSCQLLPGFYQSMAKRSRGKAVVKNGFDLGKCPLGLLTPKK